jgi:ribosomal protein S18 acetylase RimI-like enzyme
MEWTIRQAAPGEWLYLQQTCIRCYVDNFASHWDHDGLQQYLDNVFGEALLKQELANPAIQYFVAEAEGKAVGFMKIIHNSLLEGTTATATIELDKLYVAPAFKSAGLGHRFMDVLMEQAKDRKTQMIWLKVIDTNEPAKAFYSKKGFEFYGTSRIDVAGFKEELRGMWIMTRYL